MYSEKELTTIVSRSSDILEIEIEPQAAREIAKRSRGTPRIANRLLKRVRDYALVLGDGNITLEIAKIALDKLEIDELGLDNTDKKILETMIEKYAGKPVGVETLAATINEEVETVEDVYEPYLMQIGFLARTPRGRIATPLAYEHLGREYHGQNFSEKRAKSEDFLLVSFHVCDWFCCSFCEILVATRNGFAFYGGI